MRFRQAGITFAILWMIFFVVNFCTGCSHGDRLDRLDYLMISHVYLDEGEYCDIDYRLCKLEQEDNYIDCQSTREQCMIAAYRRFKVVIEQQDN